MLVVLSGLPGVGKTTIARELAAAMDAVHVRIDSIEQALRNAGWKVEGEGYSVAHAVAEDNLRIGRSVVADCVNPWPLTRREWLAVAHRAGVRAINVEVVCWTSMSTTTSRVTVSGHHRPQGADVVGGGGAGLPSLGWRAACHRHRET